MDSFYDFAVLAGSRQRPSGWIAPLLHYYLPGVIGQAGSHRVAHADDILVCNARPSILLNHGADDLLSGQWTVAARRISIASLEYCAAFRGKSFGFCWRSGVTRFVSKSGPTNLMTRSAVRDYEKGRRVPIANNLAAMEAALRAQGVGLAVESDGAQRVTYRKSQARRLWTKA